MFEIAIGKFFSVSFVAALLNTDTVAFMPSEYTGGVPPIDRGGGMPGADPGHAEFALPDTELTGCAHGSNAGAEAAAIQGIACGGGCAAAAVHAVAGGGQDAAAAMSAAAQFHSWATPT